MKNPWRTSRLKSFYHAFNGLFYNLKNEPNFAIQCVFAIVVFLLGFWLKLERFEWMIIILLIGIVLTTELFNTVLEKICDRFLEEADPRVKVIKDSSAAAVLMVSVVAACIGLLIFVPHLISYFSN